MTKIDEIMVQVGYVARSYMQVQRDFINDSKFIEHTTEINKLRAMIEDSLKAPDGWQLVPVYPTDEMLDAACISQAGYIDTTFKEWADKHSNGIVERIRNYLSADYKAMLSAAPEYEE
jgi:hypothetical protein